jgi:DNA-binding response OmpR family regulator
MAQLAPCPWRLAAHLPPEPEPPPSETKRVVPGKQTVVALLVEDNRADALIIEEAIAEYQLPIQLHVVQDGEMAFEFLERADRDAGAPCPQILLLDLNLPKRSGKEVLQRVRQSPKCKAIPVLIISSSNSPKDRQEVLRWGANEYFCKPTNHEEFLKVGAAVRRMLERSRA